MKSIFYTLTVVAYSICLVSAMGAPHQRGRAKRRATEPQKAHVSGYDFHGGRAANALPSGSACPESNGEAIAIADACLTAKGRTKYDEKCNVLCSVPIAKKGNIAGFDFDGFGVRKALAIGLNCAQSSAKAISTSDACLAARGKTSYDEQCEVLCSVPIASKGNIAGFDFNGFAIRKGLPENFACAQTTGEDLLITDNCLALKGKTSYDVKCNVLCSLPVKK